MRETVEQWKRERDGDTPILIRASRGWNLHGVLDDLQVQDGVIYFKKLPLAEKSIEHMEIDNVTKREQTKEEETTPWIEDIPYSFGECRRLFYAGVAIGIAFGAACIGLFTLMQG